MKLFALTMTVLALACGAPEDDSELGSAQQGLMFAPAGATQPGVQPGTEFTCVQGQQGANQNCVIPRVKALRFYMYGPNGAAKNQVRQEINGWYQSMVTNGLSTASDGWLFSEATDLADPHLTLVVDVNTGTSGYCEGQTIKGLSCLTGSTTGVQAIGLIGTYHTWASGVVPVLHVDTGEIGALPGLSTTQRNRLVRHAVWSGLLRFGGIGLNGSSDGRCNNSTRLTNQTCTVTAAHACSFNGFGDGGNLSSVWIGGSDCGT